MLAEKDPVLTEELILSRAVWSEENFDVIVDDLRLLARETVLLILQNLKRQRGQANCARDGGLQIGRIGTGAGKGS